MSIENWLNESVKNQHWFATVGYDVNFFEGYRQAEKELRDRIQGKSFIKKEDYLRWTTLWKATYSKLTSESRMSKSHRKASLFPQTFERNIARHLWLRGVAFRLLELRSLSKELAEFSYLRERETEAA